MPFVIYNTPISLDDKKIGIDEYFTLLNDENLKEFVPSGKQGHKTDIYTGS